MQTGSTFYRLELGCTERGCGQDIQANKQIRTEAGRLRTGLDAGPSGPMLVVAKSHKCVEEKTPELPWIQNILSVQSAIPCIMRP